MESIPFLSNNSDRRDRFARARFSIWAKRTVYNLIKLRLAPHETRAIDLRKLRDAQQADFKGNKIPAGATDGSVHWIRLDNLPVVGRLVVIARHGGLASNFDCPGCPCPPNDTGLSVSPATADMLPGETAQMSATETETNCKGQNYYYDETDSVTWSSANTSVATISSRGLVTAFAPGSAVMTASMSGCTYIPYYGCACQSFNMQSAGSCNVDSLVFTITSGGAPNDSQGVVAKQAFNLKIQAKTPAGVVPDTAFGNQNVTFTLVNINRASGSPHPRPLISRRAPLMPALRPFKGRLSQVRSAQSLSAPPQRGQPFCRTCIGTSSRLTRVWLGLRRHADT
jgi:Bacterial Ig-like domain (group 2)